MGSIHISCNATFQRSNHNSLPSDPHSSDLSQVRVWKSVSLVSTNHLSQTQEKQDPYALTFFIATFLTKILSIMSHYRYFRITRKIGNSTLMEIQTLPKFLTTFMPKTQIWESHCSH